MVRFYNIPLKDILEMSTYYFGQFVMAIEKLEAQEQLRAIEASSFMSLKQEDRKKIFSAYSSKNSNTKKKTYSMDEAVRFLQNGK